MNHRNCPLCSKSVSAPGWGKHILSSQHLEQLASFRPGSTHCSGVSSDGYNTTFKEKVKEKRMVTLFAAGGMTKKLYACFGCHTVREKDDLEHFRKHPDCATLHQKRALEFLALVPQTTEEKAVEKELALSRKMKALQIQNDRLLEENGDLLQLFRDYFKVEFDGIEDIKKHIAENPKEETSLHRSSPEETSLKLSFSIPSEKVVENAIVQSSPPQEEVINLSKVKFQEPVATPFIAPAPIVLARQPPSIIRQRIGPKMVPKRLPPPLESAAPPPPPPVASLPSNPWEHLSLEEMEASASSIPFEQQEEFMEVFARKAEQRNLLEE